MKLCDLHTHSTFSDGTLTPTELAALAKELGLGAVALTDHNTARGLPEFTAAGRAVGVTAVPGCEFSTDWEGKELHVVGLFFPEDAWPEVEDYVELAHIAKRNSNLKMIDALRRDGYDVTFGEAAALTDAPEFNRAHVARLLMQKGYVPDVKTAFDTLLKEGNGYYVPPRRISAVNTVKFIRAYGAVPVLAHPFLNLNEEGLERFLPQACAAGLAAMETRYSEFDAPTAARASALAARFGLAQSGGSDFHGAAKPAIALGTGKGDLAVPFAFYETLRAETGR